MKMRTLTLTLNPNPIRIALYASGTAVVGNGARDENIPKTDRNLEHPLSMLSHSFQWVHGRANLNADPPTYGYYGTRCPRYHRFTLTRPGNVTFVSRAASDRLHVLPSRA